MEILQVVGFALVAAVLAVALRREKPEIALLVGLGTGALIFLAFAGKIGAVLTVIEGVAQRAGLNLLYLEVLLKIVGIAYLAEFGAQLCRDAGEGALAVKVEFAAKILILLLALPVILNLLDLLLQLVGIKR
ncbi:stage III sporulation protein AD [Ammonifex thiophilus]|uniref:Stage III sporulation protein AD n=1 Tax=Ammonifex thiophilus TaxID=444093 RepID=A0A3D8P4L0_9THEO|nr:stage III sporulation protein AD [Ammonifex thiophilus]RDV82499.1 stage III sporulation protein AD [Ammonifex thiophilus]